MRVKRYYKLYLQKRAVFDEASILDALNPMLHREVVGHVLSETLGRLPLFEKLSPAFKLSLFPVLKPRQLAQGEVVFVEGTESLSISNCLRRLNVPPAEILRANQAGASKKAALLELAAAYGIHEMPEPWALEEMQQSVQERRLHEQSQPELERYGGGGDASGSGKWEWPWGV